MQVQIASWDDVIEALALEAVTLGDDVAWDLDRVATWWDAGVETDAVVKDGATLVAYACAMHLTAEAFDAIADGELNPEHLELSHTQVGSGHYWVGIVVVDPAYRRQGAGRLVLDGVMSHLRGRFVADVYSDEGRALLESTGWKQVLDREHPVYVVRNDTGC